MVNKALHAIRRFRLNFQLPLVQQGHWGNNKIRFACRIIGRIDNHECDGLDGFPQSHFITKATTFV